MRKIVVNFVATLGFEFGFYGNLQ